MDWFLDDRDLRHERVNYLLCCSHVSANVGIDIILSCLVETQI